MPGIFGIIDREPGSTALASERLQIVRRMAAAMRYESAYVADIVSCPPLAVCAGRVGWPYESDAGAESPQHAILTTGEALADGSTVSVVEGGCHAVGCGAARLARTIQRHGIDGLKDVDGAVAGFWIDQRHSRCVLFNDRYGVERLFVHTRNGRFYFASEAKAILAVMASGAALDAMGLAEWLSAGCTIGARSLFKDIEVLDSGSALIFEAGRGPTRTRYFDRAALEQLPQLTPGQFVEEFADSLSTAVTASTPPSRAALSLTGGLDSRLVLACLDAAPNTVPCYTFGSMYRTTKDVSVASTIAARCRQSHQVLELGRGFLDQIDDYFHRAVYASDGYIGLPGSAELYLNGLARRVAPVRVTGNWGGELMRGVRAFKLREPKGGFTGSAIRQLLPEVAQTFARTSDWPPLSYTLFQQMPHQAYGRYAVERSQVQMRSPFLANGVVKALYQAPASARSSIELVRMVLARCPALIAVPTDTGRLGDSSRAVQQVRQAYRRLMVKGEYLTSHGAPDWMAALSSRVPILETAFLGRDKFHHFRYWMRHELSGFVRNALRRDDSGVLTDWFDMRRVGVMVEDHIAGRANYTDELDKLMTVAAMQRAMAGQMSQAVPAAVHPVNEVALQVPTPV